MSPSVTGAFFMAKISTNSIGIFDSGIGGLTVAHAINSALPNESITYFGDIAHLPYGDKSKASIQHYSTAIVDFLLNLNCKAIVMACNTASAFAFESVRIKLNNRIPILNVIDPVVQHISKNFPQNHIGVIGTKGTINSGIYKKKLLEQNSNISVSELATPLLAPMIDEGYVNNNISSTIIQRYLRSDILTGIDNLILGCTHYPLIKQQIKSYYRNTVDVIDSAELVADSLNKTFKQLDLHNQSGDKPNHKFYASDYTESFERSSQMFFGSEIKLVHHNLWS